MVATKIKMVQLLVLDTVILASALEALCLINAWFTYAFPNNEQLTSR